MLYFAYGSNISIRRLRGRAPSAKFVAVATLKKYELKFHKAGTDDSGKCDVAATVNKDNSVIGVIFDIRESEKTDLDRKEGLGSGYEDKVVEVTSTEGEPLQATMYYATNIDPSLKPYHWYKEHVLRGAKENGLPEDYIQSIESIESVVDPKQERHETEMAIYRV